MIITVSIYDSSTGPLLEEEGGDNLSINRSKVLAMEMFNV